MILCKRTFDSLFFSFNFEIYIRQFTTNKQISQALTMQKTVKHGCEENQTLGVGYS